MIKKKNTKIFKRIVAYLLSLAMMIGSISYAGPITIANASALAADKFKKQADGRYAGLPLFNGNPDDFDEYVDYYLDFIGLDGVVKYAIGQRQDYTLRNSSTFGSSYEIVGLRGQTIEWDQPNAGVWIPGDPAWDNAPNETLAGYQTEIASAMALGQTWNKALVQDAGEVVGNEKLNQMNYNNGSNYMSSIVYLGAAAVHDIRSNPLSGRLDEDFGEDSYHAAMMVQANAHGLTGYDDPDNPDGFWTKMLVNTKHFTNYNAQLFRNEGSSYNSARGTLEYTAASAYKGFTDGSVQSMMTTYGRNNAIPNGNAPILNFVQSMSRFGIHANNDNGAETRAYATGYYGNGFDTRYATSRNDQLLWQAIGQSSGGHQGNITDGAIVDNFTGVIWAVLNNKFNITYDELRAVARTTVVALVRQGILNERDENNLPKDYPFADTLYQNDNGVANGKYNLETQEHQDTALAYAEESTILLKNTNNVLPLNREDNITVVGNLADIRSNITRTINVASDLTNIKLSPLQGIASVYNDLPAAEATTANINTEVAEMKGDGTYISASKVVALKASNGKYITVTGSGNGTVAATAETLEEATQFEVYAWGQADSVNYRIINHATASFNGRWLTGVATNNGAMSTAAAGNFERTAMTGTNAFTANQPGGSVGLFIREPVEGESGKIRLVNNAFNTGYMTASEALYYTQARYVHCSDETTGALTMSGTQIGAGSSSDVRENAEAKRTANTVFEETVIKEAGDDVATNLEGYAVVVVGTLGRHSQGEGSDRIDLDLGKEQYELVANVADKFKGKTIVILKTSSPVIMEQIQENPNVAAILYQPYAGQYDGYALARILFGDATPTGRISQTWYSTMDALPSITKYVVGEGITKNIASTGSKLVTVEQMSPYITKELNNADPIQSELTYMYTNPDNVTYEFGYGLSYGDFTYSNIVAPASVGTDPFEVKVDVTNATGRPKTAEVVQLYVTNKDHPYKEGAPKKQLVSFEKVEIAAGETKTVKLTVDPADFKVWNTVKSEFTVLDGNYTIQVGCSSNDISLTADVKVNASELGVTDISQPIDVYASSFANKDVIYLESSRQGTMDSLRAKEVTKGYNSVVSKKEGAWTALKNVDLSEKTGVIMSVAAKEASGQIELRLDAVDGELLAVANVPTTSKRTYTLVSSEIEVNELDYVDVNADFQVPVSGVHDLYLVFSEPDLRVSTILNYNDSFLLKKLVSEFKNIVGTQYTTDTYATLVSAIEDAEALLEEINTGGAVDSTKIQDAKDAILTAAIKLELLPSKDALSIAIAIATQFVNDTRYTVDTREALSIALEEAKAANTDDAAQEQVNTALTNLNNAIADLMLETITVVKTALQEAIEMAKAIDSDLYTTESYALLSSSITSAEAVNDNESATQEQVDSAVTDILIKAAGLVRKPEPEPLPNKDALGTAIAIATLLVNDTRYTTETRDMLGTVLEAAKTSNDDIDATQEQIDTALTNLNNAIADLAPETVTVVKTALQDAIAMAQAIDKELYTAESYTLLSSAITSAEAVNTNESATQMQIDSAVTDILIKAAGLVRKVDKAVLKASIDVAESVNGDLYTTKSYAVLSTAITAANAVNNNANATQEQVDGALTNLVTAIANLGEVPPPTPEYANLTGLNKAITDAKAVKRANYTAASLAAMDSSLKAAQEMVKGKPVKSQQAAVDAATKSLNNALRGLTSAPLAKGKSHTAGGVKYKVLSATNSKKTVTVTGITNKNAKKVTIPASVKINGYTYSVTAIASKAFQNKKNLKTITIKSKTLNSVGKNAFKGIHAKATIKVPKAQLATYKTLLKGKGQGKKVKIIK